jgi:hypothetical protein
MEDCKSIKVHFSNEVSTIKMSDSKFGDMYFLDIVINGESVTVMFDTGASMTALKESTVNLLSAVTAGRRLKAGGSTGSSKEYKTALLTRIRIGSNEIFDKEVLVVPDAAFDFGLDDEGNQFTAQGFLGWDIISLFMWTVDRKNQIFTVEKSLFRNVVHNLSWHNFPLVKVKWNGKTMLLGFDSGHTETILGKNMIERLDDLEKTIDSTVGADGTLEEEAYRAKAFSFAIGSTPVTLKNIVVLERDIFGQACPDMMGLLGSDILQGRKWVLDYPNESFEIMNNMYHAPSAC